jgi:hypothetical protein
MLDDDEHCKRCGTLLVIYGYCDVDGRPYCELCWQAHVLACAKCKQAVFDG